VIVSGIDEDEVVETDPAALVLELARRKARAVAAEVHGDALVVGCDSVLDVDGTVHAKPSSVDEARQRLRALRGQSAVLRTGHCVIDTASGQESTGVASTTVRFGEFSNAELETYLATGEALAVAGAFTLDGRSAPFVDGVDGDPSNVIGLSLPLLRRLLLDLGVSITELWTS
jgi:septum formation protein